jgi:hypothetical protein
MGFVESREIIVHYCSRTDRVFSVLEAWETTIPPIKTAISYATAMHELGHLLGRFPHSASTMVRERWAWRWAEHNALIWTSRMARHRDESLEWYVPRAKGIDAKLRRWRATGGVREAWTKRR